MSYYILVAGASRGKRLKLITRYYCHQCVRMIEPRPTITSAFREKDGVSGAVLLKCPYCLTPLGRLEYRFYGEDHIEIPKVEEDE